MRKIIPSWTCEYDLKENREIYLKLINEVFDSGRLLFGRQLENFEKNFSNYIGTKYAVGCDNATNALFLILKTIGIKNGDEIITVSNTAIPTVSAIRQANAIPIFAEINKNGLMDINKVMGLINSRTKAIIVVHLYGYPLDINGLLKLKIEKGITIIEDCSQAHGAKINGQKVGSIGDFSAFSFYPTKSLGAFGDAGIICTNELDKYNYLRELRFYGIEKDYVAKFDGYNSRMDEIQAAILNFKLTKLDENIMYRDRIARKYKNEIKSKYFFPIPKPENSLCSNYLMPFYFKNDRDLFKKILEENGIITNISYKTPIHLMPAYKNLGYKKGDLPITEKHCNQNISLPIFDYMPMELVSDIIKKVNLVLNMFDKNE